MAPLIDIKMLGIGDGQYGFWGAAVGRTLTVDGGFFLHYDESDIPTASTWRTKLVD
jgi:hypothetical protein